MTRTSGSYTASLLGTIRTHLEGLQGYDVMALELIQNADDAKAEEITFDITQAGLLVCNSGYFRYCGNLNARTCEHRDSLGRSCDFHRIIVVASGEKLMESDNIGRFGIGFVSAYQIADHPQIRSSGIALTLKPEESAWELDEPFDEPNGTSFFLPWARDPNTEARRGLGLSPVSDTHIKLLGEDLQRVLRESLLFLRHVKRAEVRRNGTLLLACDLERSDGTDLTVSFRPGGDVERWYLLRADASDETEALYAMYPKLEALHPSTKVSLALRVEPQPLEHGLLYAFLPTEQATRLPLHLNADFFPESDRKSIILTGHQHQQAWNEMLVRVAARALARDPEGLRDTLGDTYFWRVIGGAYDLHSESLAHSSIFRTFWERLKSACQATRIVQAQDGSLQRPAAIVLPPSAAFSAAQAQALLKLGGHIPADPLRSYRIPMLQLGAQILTLDRLVTLVGNGMSTIGAGTSRVEPQCLEEFYRPLWSILGDLLPEAGWRSLAANAAIQRLRTLPAIVSEDLCAVTIDQSYVAPAGLDGARIAELLPGLVIASRELSQIPRLWELVDQLDLDTLVSHLAALCNEGPLEEAISVDRKDLKDLYELIADLDRAKPVDDSVYESLRMLPVWLSSRGLISAHGALLPGNFTDPSGVGDLLDKDVLSDRAREFVRTKLGVETQSIEAFVRHVVPTFFGKHGPADESKYERLIIELANHPSLLKDDSIARILRSLSMIPTRDGRWSRPDETYRRTDALVSVLGDAKDLWLDTDRMPKARSLQDFLDALGLRCTPMAQHLVDRMVSVAEDELPTERARRASGEAFYALCDHYDLSKDQTSFRTALDDLRQASCFPAEGNPDEWHCASSLYAPYQAAAFRSQAKILNFQNAKRLKTDLLKELGVSIEPETGLVIRHLEHCMERDERPSPATYQLLNVRAATRDRGLIEELAGSACIYVEHQGTFVHPNRLFWSAQRLGRFALAIPQDLESYRPLFNALRIKDAPDSQDFVRIVRDISDEYFLQSRALQGEDRTVFDSCWMALANLDAHDELPANDVVALQEAATIVNVLDRLVDPDEVLLHDSEWYRRFFGGEVDQALCKPVPDLWPLFEKVGVRRLSQSADVALEFTDGDKADEQTVATALVDRREMLLRLLHDKPEAVRDKVATGFSGLRAESYALVHIQASVRIGANDGPSQLANPTQASAFYDSNARLLTLQRPVGDRSWPHVLNALFHQLIPDASGSEVPKLTLSLRALMSMPVEDGHRELSNAGIPGLQETVIPKDVEDVTSLELGGMGVGPDVEDPATGGVREADDTQGLGSDPLPPPEVNASPPAASAAPSSATKQAAEGAGPLPPNNSSNGATATPPASPAPQDGTGGAVHRGAGVKKPRPKHKVQRDKRLLSYVNTGDTPGEEGDGRGSAHNVAVEAAARAAVCKYETERGRTPKQMPLTHPGFDIVSQDTVRDVRRLIEVKGITGEWNRMGVGLSKLQFLNAQDYPEEYWLYVVEFVGDPAAMRIHPIAGPATKVTSFMFDGNWKAVVDQEPVDPVVAFRTGVRVRHRDWGYGRIASVGLRGSTRGLTIDFEDYGRRTITPSVHTLSVVGEEDDGNTPA